MLFQYSSNIINISTIPLLIDNYSFRYNCLYNNISTSIKTNINQILQYRCTFFTGLWCILLRVFIVTVLPIHWQVQIGIIVIPVLPTVITQPWRTWLANPTLTLTRPLPRRVCRRRPERPRPGAVW